MKMNISLVVNQYLLNIKPRFFSFRNYCMFLLQSPDVTRVQTHSQHSRLEQILVSVWYNAMVYGNTVTVDMNAISPDMHSIRFNVIPPEIPLPCLCVAKAWLLPSGESFNSSWKHIFVRDPKKHLASKIENMEVWLRKLSIPTFKLQGKEIAEGCLACIKVSLGSIANWPFHIPSANAESLACSHMSLCRFLTGRAKPYSSLAVPNPTASQTKELQIKWP